MVRPAEGFVEGQLAGVFPDDKGRAVFWFRAAGTWRKSVGTPVYLSPGRRSATTLTGSQVAGFGPLKKPSRG